jgi:trehalose 6-phosphate synthase/phosphatase
MTDPREPSSHRPDPSGRVLIVSNRLPLTARHTASGWRSERSSGGLVAVMGPLLRDGSARWLGWPGDSGGEVGVRDPDGRRALLDRWAERWGYLAVDIPPAMARAFYEGYANATLWPLLHGFPQQVVLDPASWTAYHEANERFAEATLAHLGADDLLWVHDYQLLPLPRLIREARPDARIGLFLHVPFPSSEVFRILPQREAVLRGMLGADLLAFQTPLDLHGFRRSLLQVLGIQSGMDRVEIDGRVVRLAAIPIGIVGEEWRRRLEEAGVRRRMDQLAARHRGSKLVLAVDRLDYTKGIPERLRAFRRLLRGDEDRRGQVTLVQVAIPTRERIPRYRELRREVGELVSELNGEFGTPEWTPVVYMLRSISPTELAALYAAADVAWVSPLRDGMNLVAKEYVASQVGDPGVLILSEFAGAAQELGEALRVNPYDEIGSVEALQRALDMPIEERRERMSALAGRVEAGDAIHWRERFLRALRTAVDVRSDAAQRLAPLLDVGALETAFAAAERRLICLDYDGTLVPIVGRPEEAVPTPEVLSALGSLATLPGTTVILVSGRGHEQLQRWFGDIRGLWLAGEHGALLRRAGADGWVALHPGADGSWKARVRPLLEDAAARLPGSLVEEKSLALAWHYRLADREFGQWLATELATTLDLQLSGTDLAVLRGRKVVEVRYAWATKGEVVGALGDRAAADLVLAIGDDRTDEDLFERLDEQAWTVKVGRTPTRARWRLDGPGDVVDLLRRLADRARASDAARPVAAGGPELERPRSGSRGSRSPAP